MPHPIDKNLFGHGPKGLALLGAVCGSCDTTTFPRQSSCPRCTREDMVEELLPHRGTLWSWTVQHFRPAAPYLGTDDFGPYGVGYVDLAGRVLVESRLTTADPDRLRIGMPVELTFDELGFGEACRSVFAFTAVGGA